MHTPPKTILIDIDGTILCHKGDLYRMTTEDPIVLPHVIERFLQWRREGCHIVLTTARTEGCRHITEKQLSDVGIFYDNLVMGLTSGPRVLINDTKPNGNKTAFAFSITRDVGLGEVNID
jgi:phosphatidate phosphatase PAH1